MPDDVAHSLCYQLCAVITAIQINLCYLDGVPTREEGGAKPPQHSLGTVSPGLEPYCETPSTETASQISRRTLAMGLAICGYHRHTNPFGLSGSFRDIERLDMALQHDLRG